ncbi:MAG: methyl-accepting chemotaxis protein, partial [Propionivibrio sp.]|nr:methyl-accepting chemotaxis protein [Propionivibrio sp.]
VTQQNAALVEEAAAAAESLEEQADQLTRAVAAFRIEATESPAMRPSRARLSTPATPRISVKPQAAKLPSPDDEWEEF